MHFRWRTPLDDSVASLLPVHRCTDSSWPGAQKTGFSISAFVEHLARARRHAVEREVSFSLPKCARCYACHKCTWIGQFPPKVHLEGGQITQPKKEEKNPLVTQQTHSVIDVQEAEICRDICVQCAVAPKAAQLLLVTAKRLSKGSA